MGIRGKMLFDSLDLQEYKNSFVNKSIIDTKIEMLLVFFYRHITKVLKRGD